MLYASTVRTGWIAACALAATACLQSPLVPCGDSVCPPGNVCTSGGCATPADVAACGGLADGDGCRASNGGAGTCQGGACQTGLCGNGAVDVGEVCDDGNLTSGDGCREDCAKEEICGDGEVDAQEACDDGNANAADACDLCELTQWTATLGVGMPIAATTIALANPNGLATDSRGRLYIADTDNHRVRRIEIDGSITTIAGTGTGGPATGDGGPATSAQLNAPGGVAVDGVGNVFVADTNNHRLRRIAIDGTIETIAGTGIAGFNSGVPARLSQLSKPNGVTVDGLGRIYVADTDNHIIRRIDGDTITTVAGTPETPGDVGDTMAATSAQLQAPYGVAVDASGRVVISDSLNNRIRRVELDDTIVTIAGTGNVGYNGDGISATTAELALPLGVAVDPQGRVVFSDALNRRIRRIALDNTITTVAGTGTEGFAGDGAQATSAQLALPIGLAVDPTGRIAVADAPNQRIRRIAMDGTISTAGGTGTFGFGGDASEATGALLLDPFSTAVDSMGRIYVSDTFHHCVRRVELDGTFSTIAGTGLGGYSGDNGLATRAQLNLPNGIRIDGQGRLVIADTFNHRIRRVDTNGIITTIAGTGVSGSSIDGLPAIQTKLANPNDIEIDSSGRVLIADTYNSAIRRIKLDNTIETVVGTGSAGYDGENLTATASRLAFPYNVGLDGMGRILLADTANQRIRRVELDNTLVTIAGNGINGKGADGLAPTATALDSPHTVHVDSTGRVLFMDTQNHVIRRIESNNTLSVLAGVIGTNGGRGDGGVATGAMINNSQGFTIDSQDRIYISDTNNERVRRIANGVITTVAGRIDPESVGPSAKARLEDPQAIAVGPDFTLVAAGASGTLEAIRNARVEVIAGRYPQEAPTGALARYRTSTFGTVGGTAIDPATGIIYITETSANRLHVITQVVPADPATWTIATLANTTGTAGFADGAAATARFRGPTGLFLDAQAHVLYIADTGNHAVRALDLATNTVTTIANVGHSLGFAGDGGPATTAQLFGPTAVTRCINGDLFVADSQNSRVRRIVGGTISTVLGDGVPASSGEGSPARTFPVDTPRGLACDAIGNLYVTSTTTVRLLTANALGIVDGEGAVQTVYGKPPRDMFPVSVSTCLTGLAVTGPTTVQVADACSGLLIQLTRTHVP